MTLLCELARPLVSRAGMCYRGNVVVKVTGVAKRTSWAVGYSLARAVGMSGNVNEMPWALRVVRERPDVGCAHAQRIGVAVGKLGCFADAFPFECAAVLQRNGRDENRQQREERLPAPSPRGCAAGGNGKAYSTRDPSNSEFGTPLYRNEPYSCAVLRGDGQPVRIWACPGTLKGSVESHNRRDSAGQST